MWDNKKPLKVFGVTPLEYQILTVLYTMDTEEQIEIFKNNFTEPENRLLVDQLKVELILAAQEASCPEITDEYVSHILTKYRLPV
jgi:hypothetical protein